MTSKNVDLGLLVTRVVLGVIMTVHGAQKIFVLGYAGVVADMGAMGLPLPSLSAAVVMAAEFGGGLLILGGLFSRVVAAALAFEMTVAILQVHLPGGFFVPAGVEHPLMLAAASAGLALTGPGLFSLDALLARRSARAASLEPISFSHAA